ncbi:general odorant-binding protein 83a [Neodiprion lecontei]|uniref:General odorant-binding protein 83a n=1 Tax=Neodiprion lecontei TaxID=441921 RepID=A0A6J0BBW3_NEOLC|nr:general odorant-binding protein 83a [Neodiprion lecontei]
MNYLLFGFACLFIVTQIVGAEAIDHHLAIRQKCFAEHGLEHASGSAAYFENPKSKCYLKCFFEHNKLFHENGDFDIAAVLVLVDESIREEARPFGEKCAGEHNKIADRCEKAYEMMKCFFKASPELFPHLGIFEPPHA